MFRKILNQTNCKPVPFIKYYFLFVGTQHQIFIFFFCRSWASNINFLFVGTEHQDGGWCVDRVGEAWDESRRYLGDFFMNCKHATHKGKCCCDQAFFEWNIESSRRSELRLQAVRAEVLLAFRGQAREDILLTQQGIVEVQICSCQMVEPLAMMLHTSELALHVVCSLGL